MTETSRADPWLPGEQAAWRVAVERGMNVSRADIRALLAAAMPADRCSACNRWSRHMRDRGGGILWCGRTACLEAVRELRANYARPLTAAEHNRACTKALPVGWSFPCPVCERVLAREVPVEQDGPPRLTDGERRDLEERYPPEAGK